MGVCQSGHPLAENLRTYANGLHSWTQDREVCIGCEREAERARRALGYASEHSSRSPFKWYGVFPGFGWLRDRGLGDVGD